MGREGKKQRAATSRRGAAAALRELGWLDGYPDQGAWRTRLGAAVVVDGALLARARRVAQTLRREHAEALAELVGDLEAWWERVDGMLRWHSAHLGDLPDAARAPELVALAGPRAARSARELSRARPELEAVMSAATVAWAQAPEELAKVLRWLTARPSIVEHGVARAIAFTSLALLGKGAAAGVDALLASLAIDAPAPNDAEEWIDHALAQLRRSANPKDDSAPRPAPMAGPRSRPALDKWIDGLLALEPRAQRLVLEVLGVLELPAALEPWCEWERGIAPKVARARALAERRREPDEPRRSWAMLEAQLVVAKDAKPRRYELAVLEGLAKLATEQPQHVPPIARWLDAFPRDGALRAAVLANALYHHDEASMPRLVALWDLLAAASTASSRAHLLEPWRSALAKSSYWWQEPYAVEAIAASDLGRLRDVLVALAARAPVRSDDFLHAALWVAAARAATTNDVVELCLASRATEIDVEATDLARAALAIAEDRRGDAAQLLHVLCRFKPADRQSTLALVDYVRASGLMWLLREALRAGHGDALALCGAALEALPKSRWPTPRAAGRPEWIADYPPALADALARLAEVDPDAEQTAAEKLSQDLPRPSALRREIAALKARRPLSPRQATRLANLQARLARPIAPSEQRLERLSEKLAGGAVAVGVARLGAALTAHVTEHLVDVFALGRWPQWPLDRKRLRVLLALARLPGEERALAGKLLRARTGAPPWDLRDEPANAAYLAQLGQRGLRVGPWLDDTPRRVTAGGRPLELALTSDPLEVFEMGAHFETCLSPGSCNFFSVIANAADINKRVLYARRDGKVVGRCLLAITDGGALLTFHPYCHERLELEAVVRDFVQDLAARMGTQPAAQGPVQTLVARRWYDDGAHDLTGRFAALRKLGELDWSTVEPAAFLARLRELLCHEIDDITLPMILRLQVLSDRPELLAALVPFVLASTVPSVRLAAADHAFAARDLPLADRLLGEPGPLPVDSHSFPALEVVAQLRPRWMLARIRDTADAWTRRHGERGARAALQAVALEALHRPRQALAAYREALRYDEYLRAYLEPRLVALSALHA